jgi:hypothetical protein
MSLAEILETSVQDDSFTLKQITAVEELQVLTPAQETIRGLYKHAKPEHRILASILNAVVSQGVTSFALSPRAVESLLANDANHMKGDDGKVKRPSVNNAFARTEALLQKGKLATMLIDSASLKLGGRANVAAAWTLTQATARDLGIDWDPVEHRERLRELLSFVKTPSNEIESILASLGGDVHATESNVDHDVKTKPVPKKKRRHVEDPETDPGPSFDEPGYVDDEPTVVVESDSSTRAGKESKISAFDLERFFSKHPDWKQFYTKGDETQFRSEAEYRAEMVDRSTPF